MHVGSNQLAQLWNFVVEDLSRAAIHGYRVMHEKKEFATILRRLAQMGRKSTMDESITSQVPVRTRQSKMRPQSTSFGVPWRVEGA